MNTPSSRSLLPGSARLVATAALSLGFSPAARADLVALWDFNQTNANGLAVDTRAGLPARVLAGAALTPDTEGRSGSVGDMAARFGTASQRLHVADASYFTAKAAGNVMSVTYWQKLAGLKNATMCRFNAPSVSDGRGWSNHTPWSDGAMYYDTGGCCVAGTHRLSINPGATWTTWHHVALVKNGDTKEIYLDGTLLTTGTNPAPISVAFTELFIGNSSNLNESVNGDMDDFAVWDHALSAADIATMANSGNPAGAPLATSFATTVTDADGDGLPDMWEVRLAGDTTTLTASAADNDSDGLSNADELARGTNPVVSDSDADGLPDGVETNTGAWGGPSDTGTSPNNPDTDGDGLKDGAETNTGSFVNAANTGSNPHTKDYDSDLVEDGTEVLYGSNPVNAASTPITPGIPTLLAWWPFDDVASGTSPKDVRVGHAGTLLGASAYSADAEGQSGVAGDRALRITAAGGKMNLASAPWVNMATRLDKLTVSYWVKVSSQTASSAFWFTSPSANGTQRGFQAHCPYTAQTIYFDTAGCCVANQRLSGNPSPAITWANTWHHCVFLKDGANKRVYIDGNQVLSGTGAAPLPQDFTSFNVGADTGNGSILGWMDDFAIFAAPLSTQEITDLATRTKTPLQIGSSSDADADGLADLWEYLYFPGDLTKLSAFSDFDADGSPDGQELTRDTNPTNPDTDGDTLFDGAETKTGNWQSAANTGTDPKKADTDGDGLADGIEDCSGNYNGPGDPGTDPNMADTDTDGFRDGLEIPYGSNPTQFGSVPFTSGQAFLLALWNFNNSGNPAAANDAVAGFAGVNTGTYSADGGGRSGQLGDSAICFSPNQSVTVDGSFINLASPADAITISFWQKLNTVRQSSAFWVTSPSSPGASNFRGLQAHSPWVDNNIYFDHSGCCDTNVHRISGLLPAIDVTQWHHYAFLKNGSTKQVYVDGMLTVNGSSSLPLVNDFTTLTIGGGPAGYTDGCMDDFAIYAGGLTHAQICRLTAGESPQSILTPAPGGPFEITSSRLISEDLIRVVWNSTPGCAYIVEGSLDLTGGSWTPLTTTIRSGGNSTTQDVPILRAQRMFLRVTEQ